MRILNGMFVALAAVALGVGCEAGGVKPTPGAAAVMVTSNPQDVAKCTPLGNVGAPASDPNARQLALNATAQTGANVLMLLDEPGKYGGVAYSCPK